MPIESGPTQGTTRIDFREAPWVQTATSSVLGLQPSDSTKYFGSLPIFEKPRFQSSEAALDEPAR